MFTLTVTCYVITTAILLLVIWVLLKKYNDSRDQSDRLMKRAKRAEDDYDNLYRKTWKFTHKDDDDD